MADPVGKQKAEAKALREGNALDFFNRVRPGAIGLPEGFDKPPKPPRKRWDESDHEYRKRTGQPEPVTANVRG